MDDKFEKIEDDELMSIEGGESRNYIWLGEKIQSLWIYLFGDE